MVAIFLSTSDSIKYIGLSVEKKPKIDVSPFASYNIEQYTHCFFKDGHQHLK